MSSQLALYAFVMYISHVLNFVIDESDCFTMESDTVIAVHSSIFFPVDDMYHLVFSFIRSILFFI